MKTRVYVIFDKVAQESGPLFEAKNDGVAWRNFQLTISRDKVSKVDDFSLIRVGSFDHTTNKIDPLPVPEQIVVNIEGEEE